MIHVINGCGSICGAASRCCDGACDAVSRCCGSACGGFEKCCAGIADLGCGCLCRPLGGYVALTAAVNVTGAIFAAKRLYEDYSSLKQELRVKCEIYLALALVHIAFSFYAQRKIMLALQPPEDAGGIRIAGGSAAPSTAPVTSRELLDRARNMALYDFVFCFYTLVFAASFVLGCEGCQPSPGEYSNGGNIAAALLVLYGFLASGYLVCWTCAVGCCGLAEFATAQGTASARQLEAQMREMVPGPLAGRQSQPAAQAVVVSGSGAVVAAVPHPGATGEAQPVYAAKPVYAAQQPGVVQPVYAAQPGYPQASGAPLLPAATAPPPC